jgi:urea transport system permease protein
MILLLDIVTTAAILFVVASGLLAIFGVLKIINFAHGAWLTLGGYCAVVTTALGLNPWVALPLAFVAGALLGAITELIVVRPLYRRPLDAILATWGLGIVIGQLITLWFGRDVQFTPNLLSGTVDLFGVSYSIYRLFTIAAALIIGCAFAFLLEGTRLGLSTRAVIMNETLARALGIDVARVRLITFMIGTGLTGLAGVLLTPLTSVDPNMGVGWAHRRLHAGDGGGLLLRRPRFRLPRLRRRPGAGQHLRQPDPRRHHGGGPVRARAARQPERIFAWLSGVPLPSISAPGCSPDSPSWHCCSCCSGRCSSTASRSMSSPAR